MARYRTYVCGGPEKPVTQLCPAGGPNHTPAPNGHLAWHEWAEKKGKTHHQQRCAWCGLFGIWVVTRPSQPVSSADG